MSEEASVDLKINFTVDLVTAARRHLSFIRTVADSPFIHHVPSLLRSIRRYDELWMPLISDLYRSSSTVPMLLPPLDVQWVWHCHCLTPEKFREYCNTRFQRLIEKPPIFDDENEDYAMDACREVWTNRYPSEPFDLEEFNQEDQPIPTSGIGRDLLETASRFASLHPKFSLPFVSETVYLVAARHRYREFLHILKRFGDGSSSRLVPTSDILLMWMTHQSFPAAFERDMKAIGGGLEGKVVGFGETAEEGGLESTREMWERAFDKPYERAGSVILVGPGPAELPVFCWEASEVDVNRRYKTMEPRFLLEVCVYLKGKWEARENKDPKSTFIRLRTLKCHRELKMDKPISDVHSEISWLKTWHLFCEFGTKGVSLDIRQRRNSCLGSQNKSRKKLVFFWNDILRATSLNLMKELDVSLMAAASVTPPAQAPYLLKCVPDRVTDNSGSMISDVILRMNSYRPQEGRWLSRTVLNHAGKECFVIRIRLSGGFWRRGAETPTLIKWEERIIEIREGPWLYVGGSVGSIPGKVVGKATPKEDSREKKATWCISTDDVLTISWEDGLDFQLENQNSDEKVKLLKGRKFQYETMKGGSTKANEEDEQFVTLVRYTQGSPNGKATALINWKLSVVEFLPEEDAVLVLLLCTAIVRTISQTRREDVGGLLVRRRLKEPVVGSRDWGSVMLNPPSKANDPHLQPWYWNAKRVLASAEAADSARQAAYGISPADGKDSLYRQGILGVMP
ncbi:hypothetical protein QJS10_CPB04g00878 [Acorus calamus]|uniref:GRPD C-terminal domain-containing protein n=1 Tax=Acorus calamus TaxID=4465 RepID=A0AAV9F398_ACOCL|nr:hypothetical protein QJS10_CPB04g00878 [Acorus calamus]